MKLNKKYGNGGHVTSFTAIIGSKEARDCGFVDEQGERKEIRKIVDPEHHRIIIELAPEGEEDPKV